MPNETQVSKWGNSLAVRIPQAIVRGARQAEGDRAGRHSIRVNDQWRICFRWVEGDALEVEIVDYH